MSLRNRLLQHRQMVRFFGVGVLATLTHILLFVAMMELFVISAVVATFLAFSGAFILSYLLNHSWTFQAQGRHHFHLPRFAVVGICGLVLNMAIMYLLVDFLNYAYPIALVVVVLTVPLLSYLMNKNWAFNNGA